MIDHVNITVVKKFSVKMDDPTVDFNKAIRIAEEIVDGEREGVYDSEVTTSYSVEMDDVRII